MARVTESKKACAVNPLKMSQPLGASFAFLGLDACMPVMHGSQGCTSFGLVLLVRHLLKPKGQKVTDRNWATVRHNERKHRIKTAIQMHLVANGLPNTPENRAWAITSLSRSSSRGRG
jgi:hypothetical protein